MREHRRPRVATLEFEIEPEPQLVEITTRVWRHKLFVPISWSDERREAWLEFWMRQ